MKHGIFHLGLAVTLTLTGCNINIGGSDDDENQGTSGKATQYLVEIASATEGIGAREASTEQEVRAGNWIYDKLTGFGYDVTVQPFSYQQNGVMLSSKNYIIEKKGKIDKTIILAAHYDSTGSEHDSLGATDNGAGLAAAISLAEQLKGKSLPYNVRILLPGAEENGLNGSLHYVKQALKTGELENVIGMINYDTIGGGDIVYVHAAHSDYDEYDGICKKLSLDKTDYSAATTMRDAMLEASIAVKGESGKFVVHPAFPGYPEGETGSWSDHAGFACAGIPIAYVEATNFNINGKGGYDGYSQTTHPDTWDCYETWTASACDRKTETQWGRIWHTGYDRLEKLEELFPGRVNEQLNNNVAIALELLTNEKYIKTAP